MTSPRLRSRFGVVAAAALALVGCAGSTCSVPPAFSDPDLREALQRQLTARCPAPYRLVQRLALRAGGRQYDMIGYLVVSADDSFRAVALGEMGGRIFDLSLDRGAAAILKKPEKMPPKPLVSGVIDDIRHLFLPPARATFTLARRPDRLLALVDAAPDGRAVEYDFDPLDQRLVYSSVSEDGRLLREVAYSGYRTVGAFEPAIPTRVVLENRRWHYTLEIEILEIHPGSAPAGGGEERSGP